MKIEKFFEVLNYLILILVLVGQSTVGCSFYIGQGLFFVANALSVSRCWILKRPCADKVRDCACLAVTTGLIGIKMLGGIVS